MSSRTLVTLLAALAVLVALAFAVSMSQRPGAGSGELLLPDLKGQLNDVDRITVVGAGNKTLATLERRPEGWILAERNGHAADVGRIRKNLIALAEARIVEEKTSSPELYDRLGVEDVDKESAGGVRLDLGAAGKITGVIIGKTGVGGGDRAYARRAGEPVSWLVTGTFDLPRENAQWLDAGITDIPAQRVHAVTVTHPDGSVLRVEKPTAETADYAVAGVPAGRELTFPGAGNALGAALAGLTLENVEPAAGFDPGETRPVVARFETFDGLVVEAQTWKLPAGARVRFTASADQALADRLAAKPADAAKPDAAQDQAAPGAGEQARKGFEDVKAEAAQLEARLGPWVYTLPGFKGEQLTRKLADLLAPLPPGK
jgi:hypothetical protein